jgi:sugar O-acyltransferase (sialic acid O-acetyltransferase NeuD family)
MKILVYGSKDFGLLVADLIQQIGHDFVGFIDDYSRGENILGTYAEVVSSYPPEQFGVVVAIGYKHFEARWAVYNKLVADGYQIPPLIHERAYVRDINRIGAGAIVMAGAIVDSFSKVGALSVLWPNAIVNHDSVIGHNTFLSPGSIICGFVTVGSSCFIGAGSIVVDHRTVPDKTFIKAGSVYTHILHQNP